MRKKEIFKIAGSEKAINLLQEINKEIIAIENDCYTYEEEEKAETKIVDLIEEIQEIFK